MSNLMFRRICDNKRDRLQNNTIQIKRKVASLFYLVLSVSIGYVSVRRINRENKRAYWYSTKCNVLINSFSSVRGSNLGRSARNRCKGNGLSNQPTEILLFFQNLVYYQSSPVKNYTKSCIPKFW